MFRQSYGFSSLKSFLPESYLIRTKDTGALSFKYQARLGQKLNRWNYLLDSREWRQPQRGLTTNYEHRKRLGALTLAASELSPVVAYSSAPPASLEIYQNGYTFLHVGKVAGLQSLRDQLAAAAQYIEANPPLSERPYVAGVTYSELARVATKIGFYPMEIKLISISFETYLRATYMAYCAINGKNADDFQPSAVFMPTQEFVSRFSIPTAAAE